MRGKLHISASIIFSTTFKYDQHCWLTWSIWSICQRTLRLDDLVIATNVLRGDHRCVLV